MKSLPFPRSALSQAVKPWRLIPATFVSAIALLAAQPAAAVMVDLGNLPGDTQASAYAISGDGQVVVGRSNDGTKHSLFRWQANQGMSKLGALTAYTVDSFSLSADGRYIVGSAPFAAGNSNNRAFRWDAVNGFVD